MKKSLLIPALFVVFLLTIWLLTQNSRLENFYEWSVEDPLFYGATLDVEKFEESIKLLEDEQDKLIEGLHISQQLYPINFMRAFVESSRTFQLYKKDPNRNNAENLLTSMEKAADAYVSDLKILKSKIEELSGKSSNSSFVGINGKTIFDFQVLLNDFGLMQENAEAVKAEIVKRKKCLNSSVSFCEDPSENFNFSLHDVDFNRIPEKILSRNDMNVKDSQELEGPYLVESQCWGGDYEYLYSSVKCISNFDYCFDDPYLATNAYVSINLRENIPFEKKLIDAGIEAIPQTSTTSYSCNDLEYRPKLQTLNYFYNKLDNGNLISDLKMEEDELEDLKKWKEEFLNEQYPSEQTFENVLAGYVKLYATLEKDAQSEELQMEALDLILQGREKLINFDFVINEVILHLTSYRMGKIALKQERYAGESYLFPIRSHYSLLYLNFSPSAWRIENHPKYINTLKFEKIGGSMALDIEEAREMFGESVLDMWREEYQKILKENPRTLNL